MRGGATPARRRAMALAASGLGLMPGPAQALPLNPLNWTAAPFLVLYVCLAAGALLVALYLRERLRRAGPPASLESLNVIDLAYLAGGPVRASDAVAIGLAEAGAARFEDVSKRITIDDRGVPLPGHLEPFRGAAAGSLPRKALLHDLRPRIDAVGERLVRAGLAPGNDRLFDMQMTTLALVMPVLGFGVLKMIVGSARDKPIGFLVVLAIVTAFLGLLILLHRPNRTGAGDAALDRYRRRHERAARAPRQGGDELLIAFALGGVAALAGTPYEAYGRAASSGGSGCGSGGGGSGGGGGGCGGCGGGD